MIVKDEAHVIKNTLENICSHIKLSYYVISDTGSTDDTITIIKDFFKEKGIKGKIFNDKWEDFGHNRTLALKHARENTNCDYLFIFDADDIIHGTIECDWKLTQDAYFMKFGSGTVYKRILLVNNQLIWEFEGVLHEYIICKTKSLNNVGMIEGNYFVDSGKTGARSKDPEKYYKDALLLEKAYEKENGSDIGIRYAFYCAQSYRDSNMKEKSIEWYKKRVDLKGWNQEVYFSYLMIGRQYMDINEPEKAIYFWSLSIEADKERLECLYEIISYYRRINKYEMAFGYFKMIFKNNDFYNMDWLKVDLNEKLFSSRDVYLFLLIYEMTIILYYVHEFKLGIHFYKYLFKNSKEYNCYNVEIAISLLRNFKMYLDKITDNSVSDIINYDLELNELYMNFVKNIYLTFGRKIMPEDVNTIENSLKKLTSWYHNDLNTKKLTSNIKEHLNNTSNINFNKNNGINNGILLTITSCKRFDLFVKTINSFITCCKDIHMINTFYCIDDNSSTEDREKMLRKFPFFKFYFKKENEKGHLNSMNHIWNKLNEIRPKYWIHLEDDWLFLKPDFYVTRAIQSLEKWNNIGVHQVLFNKCYGETIDSYNLVGGVELEDGGEDYLLHVKDQPDIQGMNSAYWPHYSFRPSMCRVDKIINLGNYDSPNTFFEMDYAMKYFNSGFKSVYFNEITCLHIGRLTSDRNNNDPNNKNAYELNQVKQFSDSDSNLQTSQIVQISNTDEYTTECISIINGYLFIKEYDFFGSDIEHNNNKMTIEEMINYANNMENCIAFNTLGYFKNDFKMNELFTNEFFKQKYNGKSHGIFVNINKLINANRFYKIKNINTLDKEYIDEELNINNWSDNNDYIAKTSNGYYKKDIILKKDNILEINDIYDFWIEIDIVKYYKRTLE
jgi:hypothetical protein